MAKMINWNTAEFEAQCGKVGMDRLEAAGWVIVADAKRILASKIKGPPVTRHPGRKMMKIKGRGMVPSTDPPIWMERDPGALISTIRVVRKKDSASRNIWIMAGNFKTWWALQAEFGRGGWKGRAKSFLRPAMKNAPSSCIGILEGGAAGNETI